MPWRPPQNAQLAVLVSARYRRTAPSIFHQDIPTKRSARTPTQHKERIDFPAAEDEVDTVPSEQSRIREKSKASEFVYGCYSWRRSRFFVNPHRTSQDAKLDR
jgi:hypothetical protein